MASRKKQGRQRSGESQADWIRRGREATRAALKKQQARPDGAFRKKERIAALQRQLRSDTGRISAATRKKKVAKKKVSRKKTAGRRRGGRGARGSG